MDARGVASLNFEGDYCSIVLKLRIDQLPISAPAAISISITSGGKRYLWSRNSYSALSRRCTREPVPNRGWKASPRAATALLLRTPITRNDRCAWRVCNASGGLGCSYAEGPHLLADVGDTVAKGGDAASGVLLQELVREDD